MVRFFTVINLVPTKNIASTLARRLERCTPLNTKDGGAFAGGFWSLLWCAGKPSGKPPVASTRFEVACVWCF